jgi:hypothetical protein
VAGFGFLLLGACFAAGFLAGNLALAAGDLRVGFTCFFTMVILVGTAPPVRAHGRVRRSVIFRKPRRPEDNGGGAKNLKL